jgi:hypothetical protein
MSETPSAPKAEVPPPPAPETKPSKPPKAPPRAPRSWRRAGWVLAAVIVVALAVAGTTSYWRPQLDQRFSAVLPPAPAPSAINTTDKAVAALGARLDRIEQRLDALSALDQRVGALERRPAPDTSASLAPLQAQVQQLSARLDQMDARLAQLIKDQSVRGDSAQRILIVALADLGSAVASSHPFTAQLASVEALGRSRPGWAKSLEPLEGAAKTGVPSTAVLTQHFADAAAPAILRAEAASPGADKSLGAAVLAKLRALIVIRRTDGAAAAGGTPAEQAVATANAALDKGDLAGAVAAIDGLTGAAGKAAASWLEEARQRLDAEETVARLTRDVAADLAAGASGG